MSQVTIYLEDDLAKKMRERAKGEGISQSQWIARLIEERLEHSWPTSFKALAGAWPDFPEAEALRKDQGHDHPRELF